MKRIMILAAAIVVCTAAAARKTVTITIMHTNDTHSCILPLNPNLADTAVAGRGGYLRRIEMLRQERLKDPTCWSSTAAISRRALPTTASSRAKWR